MKVSAKKTIVLSVVGVVLIAGLALYINFNRLLGEALQNSFNSSIVADVYELKFQNLSVNIFKGDIKVHNVSLQPREKPLRNYPYINSSFKLKTKKLALENVKIRSLIAFNELILEKITIQEPEIEVSLNGDKSVILPFKDTTSVAGEGGEKKELALKSFFLKEFQLIDAAFHVTHQKKQLEINAENFNIALHALTVSQQPGQYETYFDKVALSFGGVSGKGPLRTISFKEFKIGIDSLDMKLSVDTMKYQFHEFTTKLAGLDILTIDSLYNVTMGSFDLSYAAKTIKLKKMGIKPNVSKDVRQRRHQYQNTEFTGNVGSLELNNVNFDSIMYANKLLIDEVVLDSVQAVIYKDKTKPFDKSKFPIYLGQTVRAIPMPLLIKQIKGTNVNLVNVERKPDSTEAKVNIQRAILEVKNVTNLSPDEKLQMIADLYIENAAHAKLKIEFDYKKPQFAFEGAIEKFNLPDLNPLILAYTPAKINKGTLDEIFFSGVAEQTKASGKLKFLYHDLDVDLKLYEKAKWRNGVLAFAANSVVNSSNPASTDLPPRVVQFSIERDMNKGFINVIMKSILNGLKETVLMSKENKKTHKQAVKEKKKKDKEEKRDEDEKGKKEDKGVKEEKG